MMRDFVHENRPVRVVFATGATQFLPREVTRLQLRRLFVVCTPGQAALAAAVTTPLGPAVAAIHPRAAMHVPRAVADAAVAAARSVDADGCLAIGGGSAIGLAKAVARDTGIPIIAVPTTYAGSEMTTVFGVTDAGRKSTGRDDRVLPAVVIYDPQLTVSLPSATAVVSGFNAIAHAAEALYAPDCSPVTALVAVESVRALAEALPRVAADPGDLDARSEALYGAWLAGTALGATTMSLHHQLCHILGGTFDLPHAETHTAVLPHVLALNLTAAPHARSALRRALDTADPAARLFELARNLGAEMALKNLGMPEDGLQAVVRQALKAPYHNPVEVTETELCLLLGNAFAGIAARTESTQR
ncbi:maleylacetate reductase [Mycolicibacterium goodii]|uniref:maleylacetate reductase n=1 Tax=Mycolicibacterium goodii TaxID=134601 RepID=UPI001BDDB83B|nr:maleylacetate reductase [Mycolicibacterium goodii]MBU8814430.1 maleylacetate reductase [Mycolicibacterium goodii]